MTETMSSPGSAPTAASSQAAPARIVVIGAGHAGSAVVGFLRQYGYDGAITLIGDEGLLPYHRPPLSKAWLKGEADGASLSLRSPSFYADARIDVLLGSTVESIDRIARTLTLHDGRQLPWDRLVLATGARARPLPVAGAESRGVLALRNAADADQLKQALTGVDRPRRLAIVGGGYVGLEVAASARTLGAEAVVIEREARLLARVASPALSAFYERVHRGHGVQFELAADVEAFESRDGAVSGVLLRDGRVLACDVALVGIGAIPNDALARAAGLSCEAGVVVDLDARTSDPDIFAVGDVTFRPMPHYGVMARLESVPNAAEQGRRAAAAITGATPPGHEVPWFWSDQYDVKLQIAGVPFAVDETVLRGNPDANKFAVFHMKDGRIAAAECVNSAGEFIMGRKLIEAGIAVHREKLADVTVPMKSVAA